MSEFVYLYRSAALNASPEEMQKRMQSWTAWMKQLDDKGHIKNPGQPLERVGKIMKGKEETITDGPFAEAKDVICGFTIVEAKDLNEATKLASGCPILAAGGLVEVRPVMKMNM